MNVVVPHGAYKRCAGDNWLLLLIGNLRLKEIGTRLCLLNSINYPTPNSEHNWEDLCIWFKEPTNMHFLIIITK